MLTKILDANDWLSVQVHPDDAYGMEHEGELGKTECWYIIDAEEGAEIIYGHKAQTKEELATLIEAGDWDGLLSKTPVKKGDFFFVPSGTMHAIGPGILILETQQSSDTTYRVYDFDRRDDQGNQRELHIQQSGRCTACGSASSRCPTGHSVQPTGRSCPQPADRMSSFGDFIALSDVCDKDTASLIKREVSDGVIAPGFTDEALEILKAKKKGNYCVIKIDENYRPAPLEHKQVFGITFEQGRQELPIDDELLSNVVTENKEIPEAAKRDLKIALITLKYTQSNSVCFVKDGQAIGVGAGQQSRVHCTRLAGQKADNWFLRQCPKVLDLQFVDGIRRADRDNAIDVYIGEEYMDVLADGAWEKIFKVKPEVFTREEKRAWLDQMKGVTLGSDAFFPFSDNIERAHKSGVEYIAEPGGSVRDDAVIECCNKYNMAMAFTGIRLFHH